MSTPESKVKKRVKAMCNKYGAYTFMPVQQGYGTPGLDYHGCHKGRAFAVETKAPGKKLTPRQTLTVTEMEKSGMKVFIIGERMFDNTLKAGATEFSGETELETWLLGLL